ncbi:MAG: hypothetical protein JW755_04955 [Candidatus Aminicenantes bacterium]|nr:hypothetical protein [Candidatus Aminicenantes bacterium]
MKKTNIIIKFATLIPVMLILFACNPIENDSNSTMMLVVDSITGFDQEGNEANIIQSDVLTEDQTTGAAVIIADLANAALRAYFLDPDPIMGTSQYNSIIVTRYIVSYFRSDGRNREGIDIPYSFEGYINQQIDANEIVEISFVIVREVAKAEPPLVDLSMGRSDGVLEVTAKVEFFGHDLTNREVKALGYISIFFANYGGGGSGSSETPN